jgi:hypothetical protein
MSSKASSELGYACSTPTFFHVIIMIGPQGPNGCLSPQNEVNDLLHLTHNIYPNPSQRLIIGNIRSQTTQDLVLEGFSPASLTSSIQITLDLTRSLTIPDHSPHYALPEQNLPALTLHLILNLPLAYRPDPGQHRTHLQIRHPVLETPHDHNHPQVANIGHAPPVVHHRANPIHHILIHNGDSVLHRLMHHQVHRVLSLPPPLPHLRHRLQQPSRLQYQRHH